MKILQRLLVTLLLSLGLWGSAAAIAQTITYFHNDISGSPLVATDEAGEVLWKEQYSPYGDKIERALASHSNRIGYHGKSHDDHSGLSYMGARYYDPVLGRFMGVDPVGFVEGNLHSANRYAYANNNPYKFVDPDGRHPLLWAVVGVVSWLGTEVFFPPALDPDAPDAIASTTLPFDPSIATKSIGVAVGVAGVLKSQGAKVGTTGITRSVDELSRAAAAADRGGLSAAGRALQKHGGREGSAFPAAKGNPVSVNQQGQHVVDDILTNPGSTSISRSHARFGQVTEVRAPDGRGVRYGSDGKFIGFLEPNK